MISGIALFLGVIFVILVGDRADAVLRLRRQVAPLLGRVGEAARERAVVPELPGERIVVDRQLVCHQFVSGLVVAGDDAPHRRVGRHGSRRSRAHRLADPELVALTLRDELDPVRRARPRGCSSSAPTAARRPEVRRGGRGTRRQGRSAETRPRSRRRGARSSTVTRARRRRNERSGPWRAR